jgi:TPR repeat protein
MMTRYSACLLLAVFLVPVPVARSQTDKLLEAAEKGDANAQVRLAYELRDGRDRKMDHKAAAIWFGKAAEQGNMEAVDSLARLYEFGVGVKKDPEKARALYLQASQKGFAGAQLNLARCLREGIGGKADAKEALKWNIAAFQIKKNGSTGTELLTRLLEQGALTQHESLLGELCETKNARLLCATAQIYYEGLGGIAKDRKKVAELFAKARANGMGKEKFDSFQLEELAAKKAAKGAFAYLPTNHLDQGLNMCAPTSAAMALQYYHGKPFDPYVIKRNCTGGGPVGTGTSWDHLNHGIKFVSGVEWEFKSYPKSDEGFDKALPIVLAETDARRVVLIDLGPHTVVLVGYDAGEKAVFIQNPAFPFPGVHKVTYDRLRATWHSPWHVTTTKGVSARPMLLTGASEKNK